MKLESLKLEKFKSNSLKKEQMYMLSGGGIATSGGNICLPDGNGCWIICDYGYDAIRSDGSTTYHNRTNVTEDCPIGNS